MADTQPYDDVKSDAERLTKKRLEEAQNKGEVNDLVLQPIQQAVTPNDLAAKEANTGGVSVQGSPDNQPTKPLSDGFTDGAAEDAAAPKASKASK